MQISIKLISAELRLASESIHPGLINLSLLKFKLSLAHMMCGV